MEKKKIIHLSVFLIYFVVNDKHKHNLAFIAEANNTFSFKIDKRNESHGN